MVYICNWEFLVWILAWSFILQVFCGFPQYCVHYPEWNGWGMIVIPWYITGVKIEWSYISTSLCSVGNGNFVFLCHITTRQMLGNNLHWVVSTCNLLQFVIALDTSTSILNWQHYKVTCIHSFIYFAFCNSIQGLKQPKGYRTCHIANNIHIEWVYNRVHLNTKPTKIQV